MSEWIQPREIDEGPSLLQRAQEKERIAAEQATEILRRFASYGIAPSDKYPTMYDALIALVDVADKRIAELERELAMNGAQMAGDSALIRGLKQENARLLDICQVTRIMLRNVLRERDFGWCMGEVTEIVKRLDAVVLGQRTALEEKIDE